MDTDRMWQNMESTQGLLFSQRVLLALIEKGMSREAAYDIVQRCSLHAWDQGEDFRRLVRQEPAVAERLEGKALEELFDYSYYVAHVDETFKRAGVN